MKKFLIQTINNRVEHDFGFHLIKAIEYNNWFYNEKVYNYVLSEQAGEYKDFIPVGSLEFVFQYLEQHHHKDKKSIKPINIPHELSTDEFLNRNVYVANKNNISLLGEKFIKSNSEYKSFTDVVSDVNVLPDGEYLVSDVIDIESEWRAFICQNELVGLKHYTGDFRLFPNISLIEKMISSYTKGPNSYTLDVGINKDGCFVIEVHPFVSCGLYGFADYKRLPVMFIQGYNYMLKN
ncbi:ATP-grasp domain-containing protein [Bacillus cereus group sp. TH152-1LC]|uniref:ATP-grasp domain-containing protein n=1 Tax=Bacillus cereus group sp. TH152-1LC TaxID=3018060 RepID=UPI0022E2B158|nr:ATP-grasp domain-containing protein [Bacillus cereus group sp. TH152-1LC]MDA1675649.1 ATP-grasp domain-containing protein [Bacillus cereus group sp. TH152-1LC]